MKKAGNPGTLLVYCFSSGLAYAGASYLSGILCDSKESFEKNITNYVTYKVKYPRRLQVERKHDPTDYTKSEEEQDKLQKKVIDKHVVERPEHTFKVFEKYNMWKNFLYGLVFGGCGVIYKRQFTIYLTQKNISIYNRLLFMPFPIICYYLCIGLFDNYNLEECTYKLKRDFLGQLIAKLGFETASITLYDNVVKDIQASIKKTGGEAVKISNAYGGIRVGLTMGWLYVIISKYQNRNPLIFW